MSAGGSTHGLRVTAFGSGGREMVDSDPGSMNDPSFFRLTYSGKSPLKSITFFGRTASPTALGKGRRSASAGIVFDKRKFTGIPPFGRQGFPFTVGSTSGGLAKKSVRPAYSGRSAKGQFRTLTLHFASGLKKGQGLRFGVDRDLAISGYGGSNEGNSADELGGAVFLPQGKVVRRGMVFVARLANGKRIHGVFRNHLGRGWTAVDGYGVVNAQKAVLGR
jgi:hypothetical protein